MALLLPIWFSLQALPGEESCPSPADVEARVHGILHLPAGREVGESYLIERHEAGLYVELRGTDSALIGQRTLAYAPAQTCEEMAQAAAVVLAAWLSDVHPDFAAELPPPEPPPKVEPPAEMPKPPEPVKPETPVLVRAPTFPLHERVAAAAHRWDLALAVGSDYTAQQLALAGYAAVALVPGSSPVGVALSVVPTTPRTEILSPGSFRWSRSALMFGPLARLSALGMIWDAGAGPALGWLRFAGGVFDRTFQPGGLTWGGFLSLRASLRGRWGAFALIEAQYYPAKSSAFATGVGEEWTLPPGNAGLFIGARLWP